MHFYDIVPVDHLLERMAQDRHCPAVSRVMTELLLNSFYPQAEGPSGSGPETEQLNRCMQFVTKNPAAAEVFYGHLHHFTSIGHIAKLVTVLFTFLVTAVARSSRDADSEAETAEGAAAGKRRRAPKVQFSLFVVPHFTLFRARCQSNENIIAVRWWRFKWHSR